MKVYLLGAESSPEEENGQISSSTGQEEPKPHSRGLASVCRRWGTLRAVRNKGTVSTDFSFREVAFKKFWREQARDQETALGF